MANFEALKDYSRCEGKPGREVRVSGGFDSQVNNLYTKNE